MRAFFLLLLLAAPSFAADPPAIRLPELAPVPQPMPAATPVSKLTAATLYVVDGDTDYLLLASPKGLVTTTTEAGPVKVRGVFADGNGKVETRTYKGKAVTFVEAAGTGRVELLIVPKGAASEADVIRRTLDVDAGQGPQPPPTPTPTPTPTPQPIPGATGLRVLFVYESSANMTREQLNVLNSTAVRAYLNAHCAKDAKGRAEWRSWDKDVDASKESDVWRRLWAATKPNLGPLPQVVVVTDQAGETFPLPATEADLLALLQRYGGK